MICDEIYDAAVKIRKRAERFAKMEKFPDHLGGCCFWASHELFKHLRKLNYNVGMEIGRAHV